jgi:hypothetical protein
MLQNDPLRLPPFYFGADPDPAFHFDANADPDPNQAFHFDADPHADLDQTSKNDADPDPKHLFLGRQTFPLFSFLLTTLFGSNARNQVYFQGFISTFRLILCPSRNGRGVRSF